MTEPPASQHDEFSGPAYPGHGRPCNGCGVCCVEELCPYALLVLLGPVLGQRFIDRDERVEGPCEILEWDEGRAWCGLVRHPERWFEGGTAELGAAIRKDLGDGTCDTTRSSDEAARADHEESLR